VVQHLEKSKVVWTVWPMEKYYFLKENAGWLFDGTDFRSIAKVISLKTAMSRLFCTDKEDSVACVYTPLSKSNTRCVSFIKVIQLPTARVQYNHELLVQINKKLHLLYLQKYRAVRFDFQACRWKCQISKHVD